MKQYNLLKKLKELLNINQNNLNKFQHKQNNQIKWKKSYGVKWNIPSSPASNPTNYLISGVQFADESAQGFVVQSERSFAHGFLTLTN